MENRRKSDAFCCTLFYAFRILNHVILSSGIMENCHLPKRGIKRLFKESILIVIIHRFSSA